MKREEIRGIFKDATDEQIKAVMDLNGSDIEKAKGKVAALEAELNDKNSSYDQLNGEFETLKTASADGESWRAKYEALVAENDARAKQEEADRILKEKNDALSNRFNAVVGEKKFSHHAVKEMYLRKFSEAVEAAENQGKDDADVFRDLIKDDASAFQGGTIVRLAGGRPLGVVGGRCTSRDEILKIRDSEKRQREILNHPDLFPEINN